MRPSNVCLQTYRYASQKMKTTGELQLKEMQWEKVSLSLCKRGKTGSTLRHR